MGIIVFIIGAGFYLGSFSNWVPFFPYSIAGVFQGSSTIFFAYIGFDAVATAAEESKNPKRVLLFIYFSPIIVEIVSLNYHQTGYTYWYIEFTVNINMLVHTDYWRSYHDGPLFRN